MSLRDLARRHGVATSYADWQGEQRDVSDEAIVAVLAILGGAGWLLRDQPPVATWLR